MFSVERHERYVELYLLCQKGPQYTKREGSVKETERGQCFVCSTSGRLEALVE